jgi:hypothetical protein
MAIGAAPIAQAQDGPNAADSTNQQQRPEVSPTEAIDLQTLVTPSPSLQRGTDETLTPDWLASFTADVISSPAIGSLRTDPVATRSPSAQSVEPSSEAAVPVESAPTEPELAPILEPALEPALEPTLEPTLEPALEPPAEPGSQPAPAWTEPSNQSSQPAAEPIANPTSGPTGISPTGISPTGISPTGVPSEQPTIPSAQSPSTQSSSEAVPERQQAPAPLQPEIPSVEPTLSSPIALPEPLSQDNAFPETTPELTNPIAPNPALTLPIEPIAPALDAPNLDDRVTPLPSTAPTDPAATLASQSSAEALAAIDGPMIPVDQPLPQDWWRQGAQSPIAIAIGTAEGTRTADGGKSEAYYWHRDPGNGADNFGTFSYQHLSPSEQKTVEAQLSAAHKRHQAARQGLPETADRRQLTKLQRIYQQLLTQAHLRGLALSELEILNGLDLANQSEEAALDTWGYIDRLIQAKSRSSNPQDQIEQARTWAYWHPRLNRWAAPGLGNTYDSILHDQKRRSQAVQTALTHHQQQTELKTTIGQSTTLVTLASPTQPIPPAEQTQATLNDTNSPLSAATHQQVIEHLTAAILRFETEH